MDHRLEVSLGLNLHHTTTLLHLSVNRPQRSTTLIVVCLKRIHRQIILKALELLELANLLPQLRQILLILSHSVLGLD